MNSHHEPARVVVADPWGASAKNREEVHQVMRAELPPIADNAFLFLWQPAAMHEEALHVLRAWNFDLKTEIVWVRPIKAADRIGEGCASGVHEVCLLAARGNVRAKDKQIHSIYDPIVIEAPGGEGTTKPDLLFSLAERFAGEGPFVELYGRRARLGWHVYGREIPTGYIWMPGATSAPVTAEVAERVEKAVGKTNGAPVDISAGPPQLPMLTDDNKIDYVALGLHDKIIVASSSAMNRKQMLEIWPTLVERAPVGWFDKAMERINGKPGSPAAKASETKASEGAAASEAAAETPSPEATSGGESTEKRKPGRPRKPRCAVCDSKLTDTSLGPFCPKGCDQKKPMSDAWRTAAERAHLEESLAS